MKTWMAAIGFYPGTPASLEYAIGRQAAIALNDSVPERVALRRAEIMAGSELAFAMQAAPNKSWGRTPAARSSVSKTG